MFEFDLADRVDDLICIFDNGNPDSDMDTISILLTGWITFLFSSILLVKYIYRKYKTKAHPEKVKTEEKLTIPVVNGTPMEKKQPSVNEFQQKRKLVVEVLEKFEEPIRNYELKCSGPDPIVVDFVTASHNWIYADGSRRERISEHINSLFLNSVNKIFHGIPHEDTFVATVDDMSLSNDLSLDNLYAEYENLKNTIKITCDCEAKFTAHLSLSPNNFEQEERKYEIYVNRLVGRLKFLIHIDKNIANFKFDGWPEICLAVGNSSKKDSRLDPKFSEVITTKLSSAIRNASVEIHLEELENFPILPYSQSSINSSSVTSQGDSFLQIQLKTGSDIGIHKDTERAYCVIELDDPAQKFQSSGGNLPNPCWNEVFMFNIGKNKDCELLFEVYSTVGGIFLGCHLVSVNQVIDGEKELLQLKSRRMKVAENITGALEVVFTFMDKSEAVGCSSQHIFPTTLGKSEPSSLQRGLDGTSIIVTPVSGGNYLDTTPINSVTPPKRPPRHTTKLEDQYGEERGRRRTRRGDVFTSLRRRFSKERSKSVVPTDGVQSNDKRSNSDFVRSVSADRSGRRIFELGSDSTCSSASELSHYSSQSTSTFIHESSTLLIECTENNTKKYYLVPPEVVGTGKWKNKKKLHIFNDHTFVAKRIQSGLSCTVCFGRFPFSLRKQGYQCRDCRLISHKECHIRIPTYCVKSTIYDIDVITI